MRKFLITILALSMVCAFSRPVMAAEEEAPAWKFYGSARMSTFWTNTTDIASSYISGNIGGSAVDDSDEGLFWGLQGNSRIGARVQGETIGGRFEYGSGPNLRMLYGTYTMGESEFLVGQTYTPTAFIFPSGQVVAGDDGLLGVGAFYTGRDPMLQWKMKGLRLALVTPVVDDLGLEAVDADSYIP